MIKVTIESIVKPMKKLGIRKGVAKSEHFSFVVDLDRLTVIIDGGAVRLDRIDGTRGGDRYFFLCPECGKRCRLLYYKFGFACGSCQGVYEKTLNRSKNCQYYFNQAMKEAWKVEEGYQPRTGYISDDFPSRPKYMNRERYWGHYRRYMKLFKKGLVLWLQGR